MRSNRGRKRRSRIRRSLTVVGLGALLTFAAGLRVFRFDSSAIAPVVMDGDYVLAWRRIGRPKLDSVVLARNPLEAGGATLRRRAEPRLVPRLVVASGGDSVQWTATAVRIAHQNGSERALRLVPLAVGLEQPAQSRNLAPRQAFLIALAPGRIDSRVLGPVADRTVRRRVIAVVWPPERLQVLATVDVAAQ